ncbi:MAG: Fic family protein [Verrucomicrobia bacterium]|nr:Fic family protein [Cytophagales bacterium]
MEKIFKMYDQEIIFASADPKITYRISAWLKAGKIRLISPKIYSANLTDTPESIVKKNLFTILAHQYPGAVLSHRSALEFKPTQAGFLFLTYTYTKKIRLPGITLQLLEGPPASEGDRPYLKNTEQGELYVSQKERALLENLQISKKKGAESKTLPIEAIEEALEKILLLRGEEGLNSFRDKARQVAQILHMQTEFEKFNKLIGALLETQPVRLLSSPIAIARASGIPYDPERLYLFEKLYTSLFQREVRNLPEPNQSPQSFANFAFFESYFSNFIEGTLFEVDEAKEIVDTGMPLPARNDDSHDILGTYELAGNRKEMLKIPETASELIRVLQERHALLLKARTEKRPGEFKERNNRAGNTHFVDYRLVRGTFIKSFEMYHNLTEPFHRAAFMMFLVSEVHPFEDGNGRVARLMMNAELVKGKQSKIIIPTVYREDYLLTLKRLTNRQEPEPFLKMLEYAHRFSASVQGEDFKEMQNYLEKCHAFAEASEEKLRFDVL